MMKEEVQIFGLPGQIIAAAYFETSGALIELPLFLDRDEIGEPFLAFDAKPVAQWIDRQSLHHVNFGRATAPEVEFRATLSGQWSQLRRECRRAIRELAATVEERFRD